MYIQKSAINRPSYLNVLLLSRGTITQYTHFSNMPIFITLTEVLFPQQLMIRHIKEQWTGQPVRNPLSGLLKNN